MVAEMPRSVLKLDKHFIKSCYLLKILPSAIAHICVHLCSNLRPHDPSHHFIYQTQLVLTCQWHETWCNTSWSDIFEFLTNAISFCVICHCKQTLCNILKWHMNICELSHSYLHRFWYNAPKQVTQLVLPWLCHWPQTVQYIPLHFY